MRTLIRLSIILVFMHIVACKESRKEHIADILKEWDYKEVLFPTGLSFSTIKGDTIPFSVTDSGYKIMTYVDSTGCVGCKMRIGGWMEFIDEVKSLTADSISFLFFFHPESESEVLHLLKVERFDLPFCIDLDDSMNKLNNFPDEMSLQTFLLDKDNRVVAVGNPVYSNKIRELYLNIITGKNVKEDSCSLHKTSIECSTGKIDMGHFKLDSNESHEIIIRNTGEYPLVIHDVMTSCGCIKADYDKIPVQPDSSIVIKVRYKADSPGFFSKTMRVYSNSTNSPLMLRVEGRAEE